MKNIFLLFTISLFYTVSLGQEKEETFKRLTYNDIYLLGQNQSKLYTDSNAEYFHTSIRPYRNENLLKVINPEHVKSAYQNLPDGTKFQRKLFHEDLIQYRSEKEEFDIRINSTLPKLLNLISTSHQTTIY